MNATGCRRVGTVGVCALMAAAAGALAQPANDDCSGVVNVLTSQLPYTSPAVSIANASPFAEESICGIQSGYTLWYSITPNVDSDITVSMCAGLAPACTVDDTTMAIYRSGDGTCAGYVDLTCNDDFCDLRSQIRLLMTGGTSYYIQIAQFGAAAPDPGFDTLQVHIDFTPPPPPDRYIEQDDAADLPATAQDVVGSGSLGSIEGFLETNGTDMFRFEICDPAAFSASTVGTTAWDTQLFIFNSSGHGVVFNDDDPADTSFQSLIGPALIPAAGTYYLAISRYDRDPLDAGGQQIWVDGPFAQERAPDGPGAANPIVSWSNEGRSAGDYIIVLSGTAFIGGCGGGCPVCAADFNEDGGVTGDDVGAFFGVFESGSECGDVNQDGGVTGDDVVFFFEKFEAGGC